MKKLILLFTICVLFLPSAISAQTAAVTKTGLNASMGLLDNSLTGTGLGSESGKLASLDTTIAMIVKAALSLVGTIFLIFTIYAGILWMTAQGNEEQVGKATGIIKASVIGLFIVMSAYAITVFVTSRLGAGVDCSSPTACTAITKSLCNTTCCTFTAPSTCTKKTP